MAFSQSDIDAIDTAMVTAAVEGIASVTIAGQTVQARNLDELRRLRQMIADQISSTTSSGGLRFRQLSPGECG